MPPRLQYVLWGIAFFFLSLGVKESASFLIHWFLGTSTSKLLFTGEEEELPVHEALSANDFPAGNYSERYISGVAALRKGEFEEAKEILQGCAWEQVSCLGALGEIHLVGAGVPRNLTKAWLFLKAAADKGDPDAQYHVGTLYANRQEEGGPMRNEALSVLYMYAASLAGHPGALMAMGYRHSQGYSVPQSCATASLNYIEVAKRVSEIYSAGMPQAVELVRLGVDGRDRKGITASEVGLFVEIAASGDPNIAAAVGKRYLLGIDGFRQSYLRAAHYLKIAADKQHAAALGLMGYMHCLGLGVPKAMDLAFSYFQAAAEKGDALGHNGLGYIYFLGTEAVTKDEQKAFEHFNASAHGGSADGMFNLASVYLTGTGTTKSLQHAQVWYTQALDRGHTPAAYTLAVMYLNGVGAARNCNIAVDLLKRVCERGSWVAHKLQEAYELQGKGRHEAAAWIFLKLAEAGHEVAQVNLAHMLDLGTATLLLPSSDATEEARGLGRSYAQRHYEMSAEQGNALSELRLGDYAYYGWGLTVDDEEVSKNVAESEDILTSSGDLELVRQKADVELSLARYKRTAGMRVTGEWMQPFVARASFNLGWMHQFGIGVELDAPLARRYYGRCREVDPSGVEAPVNMMLVLLSVQTALARLPDFKATVSALFLDIRTHILTVHLLGLGALALLWHRMRQPRPPAARPEPAGPTTAGQPSSSANDRPGDTTEPAGLRHRGAIREGDVGE